MKRKIFYTIILTIAIGLFGCDDKLNIKPIDEVDGDMAFQPLKI